ncbi:MAG: tRNA (adenosine(37)-N6)-threonylcarbamoyltransferase complex ATPase subunit type 1 TsaE [Paracoccus sp.]|uniref:tRNA (adenosine(37)-N6)-threonylcarbamoyltransferase complex ATPase subunit type 1 TsaE n=2 Tax=Paracoccus sp. TaxID=267 RepID=UPI000C5CB22A|nr:tRNA (adenosine(37)-N6)-threonylcarbamoyltransferase complex ATPase subunit type 1 TsaE [Paracoccus sp. (in: a-proteobacteria)]MBA48597.1 tRNA (adenosine(37)-N6)-threonylcarbamoyltransferase complex ATPase subunit type 1 TsaE [Paracoccus sp. (in: a-proteobacteria)]
MSTTRLIADADTTTALARTLAGMARPGLTILLDGPVGAGKTHFARAFIQARQGDIAEDVPSPTFTLVQTYDDPMGTEIWHADLYRLTDPSELDELGLDEAAETAIRLIEWPDRLEMLPDGALTVAMASTPDPHLRQITLHGPGAGRIAAIARFIAATGRAGSRVVPLAGDASARRYFRLQGRQGRAVLMDDPSGDCAGFVQMTRWLRSHGFGAPELLAADDAAGLLLVEDLGDDLLARVLEKRPGMAPELYERITDLLVALHRHPVPDFVRPLDGPLLAEQVGLFAAWYPQAAGAPATDAAGIGPVIARLHADLAGDLPSVLSLRDFHAENLIWRGDTAPLGLIDYQDAVACHPAYDLVSALQDARRDVAPAIEAACIARYLDATGMDAARFRAVYALLGAQRNLRIMGIFTRLCLRDGKPRYLDFMSRVWGHLRRDLTHPALAPLARIVAALPQPDPTVLERIRAQCPR